MKTRSILIFSLVIFISMSSAKAQGFKFGFLVGCDLTSTSWSNINNAYMAETMDLDRMVSFNINGYIGYRSKSFIGFSIEPGFIQKGGRGLFGNDLNHRVNLNYLQMPIMVDLYVFKKLFVSLGPELSYRVKPVENFKNFELSGIAGLNYSIIKNIDLGVRYNHALTCFQHYVFTDNIGTYITTGKEYNQYFQFLVRLKF